MSGKRADAAPVRLGVVGYGYWGPNLLRNFRATPGVVPAMLVDQDAARLEQARMQYPALETTSDVDRLFDDDQIDAVVIATPVSTHYSIAKRALEADKHVLVEKPMTTTVAEAEDLVRLAAKRQRCLMVDHTFLFNPAIRTIKELVQSGKLGDILYYDSTSKTLRKMLMRVRPRPST